MTNLKELFHCEKCGNLIEILNEGADALVCCGIPMNKLSAKIEDASTEKHVPYIEKKDDGVLVKVGKDTAHPMVEAHYIKFIEVITLDQVYRKELKPGDIPEAWFPLNINEIVEAREWCNIHGLWKS